jgi:endonuclease YncB( thermonuclease family)
MQKEIHRTFCVVSVSLLWLATACTVSAHAQTCGSTDATASLPEADKDEDEFYVRVDKVISPTELAVTVLGVWQPADRVRGRRWPDGKSKVKPTQRTIILEDITVPDDAEQKNAALDFINTALKESDNEVICSGSSVSVRKESDSEMICITGYVFMKKGVTLNNALVRQGLATTSNPFYKSWQEQAKQKKLGMWRDPK